MFKTGMWGLLVMTLIIGIGETGGVLTALPQLIRKEHTFLPENFTVRHKEHFVYGFSAFEIPDVSITTKKGVDA